ncbi:hypothetical protein [Zhongshania sp. BJYM1]|uniref:hypothetical protein n=1 Tax=Zhongshania aquatica TaxID=2965069 RepID=UPI0022B492AD|nr:hypothetical protein [Marortus sp. BJYM1]
MSYLIASIILIGIMLANLGFIVWSALEFRRDWPIVSSAWRQMESFEKRLLYMGLSLFIFIPALKDHPAASWYVAKVAIEILPALAGAFLVAGVIAFMRQVHEIRLQSNA